MNCRLCQEKLSAYLEGLLETAEVHHIESHLAGCSVCQAELGETRRLINRLSYDVQTSADAAMEFGVMGRIIREQAIQIGRFQMQKRNRWIQAGGIVAAAVVLVALAGIWQGRPSDTLGAAEARLIAAEVMAKGGEAAAEIKSIHIRAKMRTPPADNFSSIFGSQMVPIEMWKEFGTPAKWRIEKAGRVIVVDGTSTVMLIRPNMAVKLPTPVNAGFDTEWLHRIAAVRSNIGDDLRAALATNGELKLVEEKNEADSNRMTVVVDVRSGLKDSDYVKNKFISSADTRRTYHFDRKTGRLVGLEIHVREKGGDALVFEVTDIEYNPDIAPKVFTLELPDDVTFYREPTVLPDNEKYAAMTPQQAARAFFEACTNEDWEEYAKFNRLSANDRIKQGLGGLEIVHLGEPFQSQGYAGWFVPYEIRLKSGEVRKHNLALRKDNPAKRFIVDGGI